MANSRWPPAMSRWKVNNVTKRHPGAGHLQKCWICICWMAQALTSFAHSRKRQAGEKLHSDRCSWNPGHACWVLFWETELLGFSRHGCSGQQSYWEVQGGWRCSRVPGVHDMSTSTFVQAAICQKQRRSTKVSWASNQTGKAMRRPALVTVVESHGKPHTIYNPEWIFFE